MELFILVIIYFTNIEYYHMTLVRVFLTVEAQYFLSEKGQRIHRMSATCGILTYRNIHFMTIVNAQRQSVRTRLSMWEQQITRMMIIQTVLNISCTLPRSIFVIYIIATVQQGAVESLNQIYIESLIDQLTECIMCLDFASSFYIFFLSSPRFRQTIKIHLQRFLHLGNNQVIPINASRPTAVFTIKKQDR
jgi:hypothetical protein